MNKTLLFGLGGIIFIGFFVLAFQLTNPVAPPSVGTSITPNTEQPGTPSGQNVTTVLPVPVATTSATSANSGAIQKIDFLSDPTTIKDPINPGYYYLGYHVNEGIPDPTATENPPYIIMYISATNYFNIGLFQEPIGPIRAAAEQYLLTRLGISQAEMCQLDYMVSVPDRVNSQFAGKNLGFSFCPGAVLLPK